MRVAIGAISHETSTFTPVPTTRQDYEERLGGLQRGQQIIDTFADTNTPIGGFIEGAEVHGLELIPTYFAEPHPSGRTSRALFDEILGELLAELRAAGELDGVLLELHGSMAVEGIDDAESYELRAVREVVGGVPILAQLDIHTNMSQEMVDAVDVLIGRETYPEIDMAERGRECADVLMRILTEGLVPIMAVHRIPMIWGMNQITAHPPMSEAIAELHRIEALPGVVLCLHRYLLSPGRCALSGGLRLRRDRWRSASGSVSGRRTGGLDLGAACYVAFPTLYNGQNPRPAWRESSTASGTGRSR